MEICIQSCLLEGEIFPVFRKSPFFPDSMTAFHGSHSLFTVISPIEKNRGRKTAQRNLKSQCIQKSTRFLKGNFSQTSFQQERQEYLQKVKHCWCCQALFYRWFCACFTLGGLGSNPDNWEIWKPRAVWLLLEQGQLGELDV